MSVLIYGRDTSYNVQKVLWLLEELNVEYRHIQLGGKFGGTESEEFKRLNPMRKVPVLVDGDNVVWESNTILRYLVNAYGDGEWREERAYERSKYERWMDWSQCQFDPAFVGVFWGYYRTPDDLRDMNAVNESIDRCLNCLAKLDEQLKDKEYLMGDRLTLADIATGVFIYRLVQIGLDIKLPKHVARWFQRLKNLPGYQKWVMRDFSELKGRLAY